MRNRNESGLRQRIASAGIHLIDCTMTGSEDRGPLVGHVPEYTVTLGRDDSRRLRFEISSGSDDFDPPDVFDLMDTLLLGASAHYEAPSYPKWMDFWGHDPEETDRREAYHQGEEQARRFANFVRGPDAMPDWAYRTDRDPGRQDDYDTPEDDDE